MRFSEKKSAKRVSDVTCHGLVSHRPCVTNFRNHPPTGLTPPQTDEHPAYALKGNGRFYVFQSRRPHCLHLCTLCRAASRTATRVIAVAIKQSIITDWNVTIIATHMQQLLATWTERREASRLTGHQASEQLLTLLEHESP